MIINYIFCRDRMPGRLAVRPKCRIPLAGNSKSGLNHQFLDSLYPDGLFELSAFLELPST